MPVTPSQITIPPTMRAQCVAVLREWDGRDPWHPSAHALGMRLMNLTFFVSLPLVPQLETPDAAAKFLREALGRDA